MPRRFLPVENLKTAKFFIHSSTRCTSYCLPSRYVLNMPTTTVTEIKAQRKHVARTFRSRGPIAAKFEDCQQLFAQVSDALQNTRIHHLVDRCWRRLNIWDDDSGASSRNLDYALKSSSLLRKQVINLLRELRQTLEIIRGMSSHWNFKIPLSLPTNLLTV